MWPTREQGTKSSWPPHCQIYKLQLVSNATNCQQTQSGLDRVWSPSGYLVGDLKVLPSPDLQTWVVQAQLEEKVPLDGKETASHRWRPASGQPRETQTHIRINDWSLTEDIVFIWPKQKNIKHSVRLDGDKDQRR